MPIAFRTTITMMIVTTVRAVPEDCLVLQWQQTGSRVGVILPHAPQARRRAVGSRPQDEQRSPATGVAQKGQGRVAAVPGGSSGPSPPARVIMAAPPARRGSCGQLLLGERGLDRLAVLAVGLHPHAVELG